MNQAVFRFGIAEDGLAFNGNDKPLSATEGECVGGGAMPRSLGQLTKILQETSGASKAEIKESTSTFSFHFAGSETRYFDGSPWVLLKKMPPSLIATLEAEESGGGHTHFLDVEVSKNAKRIRPVRAAIDLVWSQIMLPAFNRAVSTGTVELYARPNVTSVHFNVVDWDNAIAMAVDHTTFWSIHAERVTTTASAECEAQLVEPRLNETVACSHLKEAPQAAIHEAIRAAYDTAQAAGRKPPNILELPKAVLSLLEAKGYRTSGRLIRKLGELPEYARRRRVRGARAT
jgi:hypothetical protein